MPDLLKFPQGCLSADFLQLRAQCPFVHNAKITTCDSLLPKVLTANYHRLVIRKLMEEALRQISLSGRE